MRRFVGQNDSLVCSHARWSCGVPIRLKDVDGVASAVSHEETIVDLPDTVLTEP